MSIYIHPTATHNLNSLVALKQATGLTITHGKRYLRLVPGEGDTPRMPESVVVTTRRAGKSSYVNSYLQGPFQPDGGSAA